MLTTSICASGKTASVEEKTVTMKKPLSTGGQNGRLAKRESCGYTMPPQQLIGAELCRLIKPMPEKPGMGSRNSGWRKIDQGRETH
jgi:hypothetical protein